MCVICSRPLRWRKAIPWRKIPIPTERGQEGGGMRNFRKNLMFEGAGGPGALQTSPRIGERKTGTEFSDFCWAQAEWRRNAELPQEFDVRGCWRAGRPPDPLPELVNARLERNFPTSAGRRRNGGEMELPQEFDARGCWRAGRPPDLLAREKTKPG